MRLAQGRDRAARSGRPWRVTIPSDNITGPRAAILLAQAVAAKPACAVGGG